MPIGVNNRSERVQSLEENAYDMLIVGGGITGAATARDAAMRGFRVACVERADFGSGTSSRSSKLIHGGLRYLEQMKFRLVFEGTHERALLREVAPHLVRPIPFLFPVYEENRRSPRTVSFGLWLYDTLAGKRRYGRHKRLSVGDVHAAEPSLRTDRLRGGAIYFDCMTDDARMCLENVLSAAEQGATMMNYVSFVRAIFNNEDKVCGAVVRDETTGNEQTIRCRVIIQCAGPWTDEVRQRSEKPDSNMIRTTKGIHLVFPHENLPVKHAVVMMSVNDRRVVFAIPRGRITIVGTTDTDYEGDPTHVRAQSEDVDYLMTTLRYFFPDTFPSSDHIQATYAGLRPLVRDDASSPYDVSREHTVLVNERGIVTIAGGKYTTYRLMADDGVEAAMGLLNIARKDKPECPTAQAKLPGADGDGFDPNRLHAQLIEMGCPDDVATHRVAVYGVRAPLIGDSCERIMPSLPFTWEELVFGVHHEGVLTPEDFLIRRTNIFYEAADQGLECVDSVADRLSTWYGWNEATRKVHVDRYRAVVEQSRQWRHSGNVM